MISIFKLIFILVVGYLIFNLFRFVFFIGKGLGEGKKKFNNNLNENKSGNNSNNRRTGNNVIELDKDQYKVE